MLTVYSTQGSPGASTTAMHLAANWASDGREILLIEADPAGGSLSHNLGIQFTPGSASFVASGLPVQSNHLIDHAQDVLFESLHVMPAPASPTGARGIFDTFADFSEELRTISENEMAVIIDGGRMTADTAASALTTRATGVVVVCRNNSQLPSLEHLRDALAASPGGDGPQACAVTVGKSPMDPEEWQDNYGLTFCGSIEIVADMATDLSAYLARSKRKSKKWRASLEEVGEKLYPYAQPPVSNRPRRPTAAAARPDTEVSGDASKATPAAATFDPAAQDPAGYGHAPPMAPSPQPGYGQSHYLPPTEWPADPQGPSWPSYGEAPPAHPYEQQPQYPAQPYEHNPPTNNSRSTNNNRSTTTHLRTTAAARTTTAAPSTTLRTTAAARTTTAAPSTTLRTTAAVRTTTAAPSTTLRTTAAPEQQPTYEQQPQYEQQHTLRTTAAVRQQPNPTNNSRSTNNNRSTQHNPTNNSPLSPSPGPRRPLAHSRRRPSPRRGRT